MSMTYQDSFLQLAFFFYLASTLVYLWHFTGQKSSLKKWAILLVIAGIAAHGGAVISKALAIDKIPVFNMAQNLSLAAFILGMVFLFCRYFFHLYGLGFFVSAVLCVLTCVVLWLPDPIPVKIDQQLAGLWLYSHIGLSFSGDAALGLAAALGGLYLLQERSIKSKNPGFLFRRLPPLDYLDEMSATCLGIGFCLFTFGLVTGFIYAKAVWGHFWGWDIKEFFSLFVWFIYAALLHYRLHAGWRGHKSAIMTMVGFFLIIFTFLGVNLFLGGHHQVFTR